MATYKEIKVKLGNAIRTGIHAFDDFISKNKGLVSSMILMTGTSGAGKTTFSVKLQKHFDKDSELYSREMRKEAVKEQTERMNIDRANAVIFDEEDYNNFNDFLIDIYKRKPSLVIVDSLQHAARDLEAEFGKDGSKIEIVSRLTKWKNDTGGTVILIGHVTKDGDFEGVNTILHDVDVHLHLSFDKKTGARKMQTFKNRFNDLRTLSYRFVDTSDAIEFYEEEGFDMIESINNAIVIKMKELKASGNKEIVNEFKKYLKSIPDNISDLEKTIMALSFLSTNNIS